MTPQLLRALTILKAGSCRPAEFAKKMWPDADGWRRSIKCGGGSHMGGGMVLAAGGYLGKLRRDGWAQSGYPAGTTSISKKGLEALAAEGGRDGSVQGQP